MNTRYLLTRSGCEHCLEFIKAIKLINIKLAIDKKIQIIDCGSWEDNLVDLEPIMKKFSSELKEGYPVCYIDGILIQPSPPDILKTYITKLVEDDIN